MPKSLLASALIIIALFFSVNSNLNAQDTLLVAWSETPGDLEATIQGDTTADGKQKNDVYLLEANKVYLQLTQINVNDDINITGQEPGANEHPATIQPFPGADGLSGFTEWPNGNFQVYGDGVTLTLRNLIMNGAALDQSFVLGGTVTARGDLQKIIMDNVITTHYVTFTFSTFGTSTDFHFVNSVATGFTNGPGGQYFGGLSWGGGSWMGSIDTLVVQNSTIHNVIGEAIVVYQQVDHGLVDHNSFVNIVMGAIWYRGQNNMTVSNNLFYNTKAHGQSAYDISGWGVWHPGGQGQMSVMPDWTDSTETVYVSGDSLGDIVDNMNRNINYHNNVWWHDEELTGFMEAMQTPWSWEATSAVVDSATGDTTNVTVTVYDSMLAVADQSKWLDDSTKVTLEQGRGVMESNNINADPGLVLRKAYIRTQLKRTLDFRDNLVSDTKPFDTSWWQYEHDGDHVTFQWPMDLRMDYDINSAAGTASSTGGPVGDPRWVAFWTMDSDDPLMPEKFVLKQNYPNPFNPTTTISFTLDKSTEVTLDVYNLLGQKVRSLVSDSRIAGTHQVHWNGLDEMGAVVPTGVYLYTLNADGKSITKKMALMK
ncbi:MAG: hypothetical protein CMH79_04655 [Nitrospinae bacterium]|nr:hypothetical protein [Nitrospinota bacterium]